MLFAEEVSSLDTESDEDGVPLSEGAHAYFICDGTVYSIYRCILMNNEAVSNEVFRRPLNCAVFLLAGGHFCGGIFKKLVIKLWHFLAECRNFDLLKLLSHYTRPLCRQDAVI